MLKVTDLTLHYGNSQILHGVSMEAAMGEVTCVMGTNGVGKTSLLRAISGAHPRSGGQVLLDKGYYQISGLAWSGRGKVRRVDVSVDGGTTWQDATLKKIDQQPGRGWAWALWECEVEIPKGHTGPIDVVAKAMDESCNTQPERAEGIWNLRGVCCNTWPRIRLEISD